MSYSLFHKQGKLKQISTIQLLRASENLTETVISDTFFVLIHETNLLSGASLLSGLRIRELWA